jgi:archaeosortase A (PGF-CTERM-specific)
MALGLVFSEKDLSVRQALNAFLLSVPSILLLNLLRVAGVFIAVSDRWFAYLPDPTGTGDASFFWAHNVVAETCAVLFLAFLVWALVRLIPRLGVFARALGDVYLGRLRTPLVFRRETR